MKFLVDENLPPRLSAWLRQLGHDAVHIKDIGLIGRPDADVSAAAIAGNYVIVTQNSDFENVDAPKVLRLAIGNAPTAVLIARLAPLIDDAIKRLEDGATFVRLD